MENLSRREFFEKFVPISPEETDATQTQKINNNETRCQILSRKEFLKFISAVGTAVAMRQMGTIAEARQNREDGKKIDTRKERSYTETAIEQSLMMVAKCLAEAIFEKLKIEHGNQSLGFEEIIE